MSKAKGLSHTYTCNISMGKLYPLGLWPILPGSRWRGSAAVDIQMQALLRPILHNIRYTVHYWFVPIRLVWEDWEIWFTGGEDGSFTAVHPYFVSDGTNNAKGSLAHRLCRCGNGVSGLHLNVLGVRAYNLIWNEWYRNQNASQKVAISKASGLDTTTSLVILKRTWKPNDYYTNSLPFLQRGPAVSLPVAGTAPVVGKDKALVVRTGLDRQDGIFDLYDNNNDGVMLNAGLNKAKDGINVTNDKTKTTLEALLSEGAGVLLSKMRAGLSTAHVFEKLARSGGRYAEALLALYGIRSSDARLQRPEFLGGGSRPLMVQRVLQTSATDNTSPQANPAGFASSMSVTPRFDKVFEEHGFIIPIMSVMPQSDYFQGIDPLMSISNRFDIPVSDFAGIGDQAILNKELYATGTSVDNEIFAYTPRYENYFKMPNRVVGEFEDSLLNWTLARKFANTPVYCADFVECNPDTDRIFAVEGQDNLLVQVYHDLDVDQPLPRFRSPGISYV